MAKSSCTPTALFTSSRRTARASASCRRSRPSSPPGRRGELPIDALWHDRSGDLGKAAPLVRLTEYLLMAAQYARQEEAHVHRSATHANRTLLAGSHAGWMQGCHPADPRRCGAELHTAKRRA